MPFDWTFSVDNALTIIGLIGGGLLAWFMLKTQVALLAQRVAAAEENLCELQELNMKVTALAVKTDTMWEFSMRRAKGEVVMSNVGTINSPIEVNERGREFIAHLIQPLRDFYAALPSPEISDEDFALEIEREFGERLLREVCIPNKLTMGACLLIAVAVAKEAGLKDCGNSKDKLL